MARRYGPWLIAAALGAFVGAALLTGPGTPGPLVRGSTAPAFELPLLGDAGAVSLRELRGKVVLVNFWATWCKPCEDEMPAMQRLYRALEGEPFELLAISVDDDPTTVAEFQRRLGISFPILLDPEERVAHAYQTFRYPETLLIDPDGVVVERYVGPKEWDAAAYVERIRRLVGGEEASAG